MINLIEVESVGFQKNLLRNGAIWLKGKKNSTNQDGYTLQNFGNHTEEMVSLRTKQYCKDNEFAKGLLEFTGESIKKQDIEYSGVIRSHTTSTLEFADGSKLGPVITGCSLPTTLVSGGKVSIDEYLLHPQNEMEDYFMSMTGRPFGKFLTEVMKEIEFEPVSSLNYESRKTSPEIKTEDYSKFKLHTAGQSMKVMVDASGFIPPYVDMDIVGEIESEGKKRYLIPLPFNSVTLKNLSKKFPDIEGFKQLSEYAEKANIKDCHCLFDHILDKNKTVVTSAFVTVKKGPMGYSRGSGQIQLFYPNECFIKLQQGSKTKMIEAEAGVGVTLWCKNLDEIMIKEEPDRQLEKSVSYVV
jgi:hypothetical protein